MQTPDRIQEPRPQKKTNRSLRTALAMRVGIALATVTGAFAVGAPIINGTQNAEAADCGGGLCDPRVAPSKNPCEEGIRAIRYSIWRGGVNKFSEADSYFASKLSIEIRDGESVLDKAALFGRDNTNGWGKDTDSKIDRETGIPYREFFYQANQGTFGGLWVRFARFSTINEGELRKKSDGTPETFDRFAESCDPCHEGNQGTIEYLAIVSWSDTYTGRDLMPAPGFHQTLPARAQQAIARGAEDLRR